MNFIAINTNDYQLFPSMVETLREIIPFSQHRIVRGKSIVRIYDHEAEAFRTVDPVYVIDGIVTDNTEYFLSLNPSDLVSIKLVYKADKLREFGSIGDGGMFLVETKIPNNAVNVPRSEQTFLLQGLTKSISPGRLLIQPEREKLLTSEQI